MEDLGCRKIMKKGGKGMKYLGGGNVRKREDKVKKDLRKGKCKKERR